MISACTIIAGNYLAGARVLADQRWADYMPSLFRHHLLKDPGYNVAYWNLHARPITQADGRYYARDVPLRFLHFSGFDPRTPWLLSRHQGTEPRILLSEHAALAALCDDYAAALERAGFAAYCQRGYGWGRSADGLEMTGRIRRLYWSALMAAERQEAAEPPDPFDTVRREALTAWLNAPDERGPRGWSRYRGTPGVHGDTTAAHAESTSPPQGLNVTGYFCAELGIGEAARLLTRALDETGSAYTTSTQQAPLSRQEHRFEERAGTTAPFDVNLLCLNADCTPDFAREAGPAFFANRYTIGYWFWEVDPLPAAMHHAFDHVDEVWTATEYVAQIFRAAQRKPVFTIPLPLQAPVVPSTLTRDRLGLPADRFVFLFVFDFLSVMERKNPLGAIEAFCAAFALGEGPVLVLKSINGYRRVPELERVRRAAAHRPDITIRDGYVSADEKNALLAACDGYVSLHRAEGLGLTLAEAMALGKPAIATGYSGNRHFMSDENSFLVDYTVTATPGDCGPYPAGTRWAEPNLTHAARLMRAVYEHPHEAARRAERARADLQGDHGVTASASAISRRLSCIREIRAATAETAEARLDATEPRTATLRRGWPSRRRLRRAAQGAMFRVIRPYWYQQRQFQDALLDAVHASLERLTTSGTSGDQPTRVITGPDEPPLQPIEPEPGGPALEEKRGPRRFLPCRRDLRTSLLIGLCCLLVYNVNARAISAGDTYPARYQPFAIWKYHTVLLDPIVPVTAQGRGNAAFWMVRTPNGRMMSLYPVVLPVLIAPLYAPAVGYLHVRGWPDTLLDHTARVMEKISASLVAALSASLLYVLLRRRAEAPIAVLLTVAYAFGTTTWVISSQALWQHGMAQLLVIAALLVLTAPCTARQALLAGLFCGLIAANRPPDVIIAAALGAYGLFWAGRRAPLLIAAAALPPSLVLLYNLAVAGGFAGGYGIVGKPTYFQHDFWAGVGGLLFSPTRGLLVFSPFLLFLVLAWRHLPRDRAERGLTQAMIGAVVLQVALYAKADWRGGISWGPRYMTDLLPFFMWMLVPVVTALRGFGRVAFLTMIGVAMAIEAIGAFCYTGVTDLAIYAIPKGPEKLRAAWDWRNAPFVASLPHGLAPAELLIEMRGNFDAIEADGRAASDVTAGQDVFVAGWALAGRATPRQVAVVIDGQQTVATQTFVDRPDVRSALHEASPAGWRIPLDTAGLAPGEHTLSAYAWASEKGEAYYLAQRKLTVRTEAAADEELNGSFRTAIARLRAHQQEPGYWLTAYTSATKFHEPRQEMNTFLTSLLVDLLDPLVATGATTDLAGSVQRARQHLTGQIEEGGLVRYHGRPDAPGIGTLGCAITPDADDTALVWRVAPDPDRRRLPTALATIDQYRTHEGLYRTWLAPRDAYQCLDPGHDPNPADIAIQMHMLQLLAKERPSAGRALCDALRQVLDEDRIWVYYRVTPLVPMLRLTDLQRAGCPLALPESRMRSSVPGQEIWVSVVRLLGRARMPGGAPADATETQAVLRQLAKDDFALLRTSPPLLYHNDLSATVARYYWSEDVGYALWLRLAYEQAQPSHHGAGG
jgi:hypothetical protein